MVKFIGNKVTYIGCDDLDIDLFEGQYPVAQGVSYNSYLIADDKAAILDTVDASKGDEWLANIKEAMGVRKPDYLVVHHMEPDHSANVAKALSTFPCMKLVTSSKALKMIYQFFEGIDLEGRVMEIAEGDVLDLGEHKLHFVAAPMVHWPEVMVSWDEADGTLYSADGFGKFGALGRCGFYGTDDNNWVDEGRRYFINIVGKYGVQVQSLLAKASTLDIKRICPLHGPILTEHLSYYIGLYSTWSSYGVEADGIMIAYTSVYGHTKEAVELLAKRLETKGCPKVVVHDLARTEVSEVVSDAFRFNRIVLATTTYNSGIFPFMHTFLNHLVELNWSNRTVALIENGSWAPLAAKGMKSILEGCKNINYTDNSVKIMSALNQENRDQIENLANELCKDYLAQQDETANKKDFTALFKIGYGLYVVTSNDGKKDNGLIVNTVSQVTDNPNRIAVCINKQNYSHTVIKNTGKMNVNCLSVEAPFKVFQAFGFQSGRDVNKFENCTPLRSDNGLVFLPRYINAFMSLNVESYVDLDSHGLFICTVSEARVLSDAETMTYTYYQQNVKPKPQTEGKKGWVCKVCGYIYEGEELPDDIVCPLCKHGAADFEPIGG